MNKRLTKIRKSSLDLLTRAALRFFLPFVLLLCAGTARAAISATHLVTNSSSSNSSSYTTVSISPAANQLVLAWVQSSDNSSTPVVPTLSGNGLTWVQVNTVTYMDISSPNKRLTMFRAMGVSPTTGSVTINFSSSQDGCGWSIVEFAGVDTSGTNGSGAIIQSATHALDSGTNQTVTLTSAIGSGNATAGGFASDEQNPNLIAGTGYTAFPETGTSSPRLSLRSEWRSDGSTTVNVTLANDNQSAGIAVEIKGGFSILGRVFEDFKFAGTAANWDGGTNHLGLGGVDVELYNNANTYITSNTTAADGTYSFTGLLDGTYKVRARLATIGDADTPPEGTFNSCVPATCAYPLPTMTWGNVAPLYGGQSAIVDDTATGDNAGPGNTYVTTTVSGANVTNVNFGFTYNLIVNADDDSNVVTTRSKAGSLRQFIKNANAIGTVGSTTANYSQFRIQVAANQISGGDSWWRIAPASVLPTITDTGTIIDGSTQTTNQGNTNMKGPEIELFGNGGAFNGININASTTMVKGLTINSFTGNRGIDIIGGGTNTITSCYIGTNYAGTAAMANGCGIYISGGTGGNNIGAAGAGNVISGNSTFGIVVGTPSTANVIKGNYIGTNASGTAAIANGMRGVEVNNGCSNTTIGGAAAGEGNIISGNTWVGVAVFNSSNTNIYGNTIGTGVTSAENLGNGIYGVEIDTGSSSTNIGGLGSGQGNVIANTGGHGVIIQPGAGANNVISGNTVRNGAIEGIVIFRAGVVIQRNLVRNNSSNGIFIDAGASNNVLVYHNTLHGNGIHGIHNLSTSTGLVLRNNIITGNGSYGVNVVAGGSIIESYNDVTDAATAPANASGRSNVALDATDLNVNPLYVNAAGGNFSLTECTSPAINQGIDLTVDQPDMNGATAGLWNNNAPELGALETGGSCAPTLAIVKQAWDLNGSAPLTSLTAPVGSTIGFLIYVKNTTAGPVTDLRINDTLDETAFQYITGSLVRTSAATAPADTASDLVIFSATAAGTGTLMSDGVNGDAASALNTGGLPDIDRITIGAVTGQSNASLTVNGHSTFGLRFNVKIK